VATQLRKATFSLHQSLIQEIDEAMANGAAPSKNALVERALKAELERLRREWRRALWEEASKDPLFLKDVAAAESAFRTADAEMAQEII
jgi:hypothetical protein